MAKEAADLVLLGDFSSIIVATEYGNVLLFGMASFARLTAVALPGRLVYDNLKTTVLYLLPAGS
jgi:sodium/potassium-transporting ATPase subunit alpha